MIVQIACHLYDSQILLQIFLIFHHSNLNSVRSSKIYSYPIYLNLPYNFITAMSPIRLADVGSDRDGPESSSYSQDDIDRMSRDGPWESTYPRVDGEWAIGDEVNEPIAIVGIGKSML